MGSASAVLKGAKLSAQKGRLVADLIRGKSLEQACNLLQFSPKKASRIIYKLLLSAKANAEESWGSEEMSSTLRVSSIMVDRGTYMKRFMARAKGRGMRIMKPTCHIKIIIAQVNKD